MKDKFSSHSGSGSGSDPDNIEGETEVRESSEMAAHGSVESEKLKSSTVPFWAKILLASVVVFLIAIGYLRSHHEHAENAADVQESPTDVPEISKRKSIPDITLTAGSSALGGNGKNVKLSDFHGKVVLLSFWASWCTPCLIELPTFIDLHTKLSAKGLVIVPVNVDENDEAATSVTDFWKTKKFPFPTFFDPGHVDASAFQVDALPSNYVLDKQGRLVAQGYGANDWSSEASYHFIEQLLRE